ncbi:MAG: hypothetical protein JSU63_13725 [Phycisphaerales bacterium]|nr:MAG: hypothetical protein JSU63_13725 [Phycisphaerales bacterium]
MTSAIRSIIPVLLAGFVGAFGALMVGCPVPGADSAFPVEDAGTASNQADDPSDSSLPDGGDTGPARPDLQLLDGGIGACCLGLVCEETSREECIRGHGYFLDVGSACDIVYCLAFLAEIDTDNDGLTDLEEIEAGLDPKDPTDGPDIDGDGIPNEEDPDIDGDGLPNYTDPDVDGDGLLNADDPDLDGDGLPDLTHIVCGDGFCTYTREDPCNCPKDCKLHVCGDLCCSGAENKCTCPEDCGQCKGGGLECCDDECVDTQIDKKHCGGCKAVCTSEEECCEGRCTNTKTDKANCGTCRNACTAEAIGCTDDQCVGGRCAHAPNDTLCDDGNDCTTDTCDPEKSGDSASGCVHEPIEDCCTKDRDCDDDNECTEDKCDTGTGTCSNVVTVDCSRLNDECTLGVCEPATGECSAETQTREGIRCGDPPSGPCDDPSTCRGGVCRPNHKRGGALCPGDPNGCTVGRCDGAGNCEQHNRPDEISCSGGICCSGECVDTKSNHEHCGKCNKACGTNEECRDGKCEPVP